MGFYYFSLLSIVPLGIALAVAAFVYWGVVHATRGVRFRRSLLTVSAIALLLLPIAEELWIAVNFGSACKEAGTFIYRKVEAPGFYDATRETHSGPRSLQAAEQLDSLGFQFYEMRYRNLNAVGETGGIVHLKKADGKWAAEVLGRPTARYQYSAANHIPHSYKVVRHEYLLSDIATKDVLAKELKYARYAPWFFIGLDAPTLICSGLKNVRGTLYENHNVLIPTRK